MIRCCLCRHQLSSATAPTWDQVCEPTDLPGSGLRCTDHDACRQRVRDIVAAHVGMGEVCRG